MVHNSTPSYGMKAVGVRTNSFTSENLEEISLSTTCIVMFNQTQILNFTITRKPFERANKDKTMVMVWLCYGHVMG